MRDLVVVVRYLTMFVCLGVVSCEREQKIKNINGTEVRADDLDKLYLNNLKKEQVNHRSRVADHIKNHADRIEILTLDNVVVEQDPDDPLNLDSVSPGTKSFQVVPYGHCVKVASTVTIKEDVGDMASVISDVILSASDGSVWSHKPSYGVRVYSRDKLLFSTSISTETENFYFLYPASDGVFPEWLSVGDIELQKFIDCISDLQSK